MQPLKIPITIFAIAFTAGSLSLSAAPPLVTGDVPTADKGHFEWNVGFLSTKSSGIERQLPASELIYGVTDRLEITAGTPFIRSANQQGFGDVTLGTKAVLVPESEQYSGIAASYELKQDNGDADKKLGTGGLEHEFRLRSQKTFSWFTPIVNVAYTVVPDVTSGGVPGDRQNVWSANFAQEWQIAKKTTLLSEVYWNTSDTNGEPQRLAWNAGVRHHLQKNLSLHAAVGRTLREHESGGPDLRVYLGVQWQFDAPWTKN